MLSFFFREAVDVVESFKHRWVFKNVHVVALPEQITDSGTDELGQVLGHVDRGLHLIAFILTDYGIRSVQEFGEILLGKAFSFPAFP